MTTPSTAKKRAPLSLAQLRTPTTVYRTATSHVFTHVWKNRPWYGVTFHALKVDTRTFWCYVILGDAAILVLGFFVFAMIGQRRTKALDLAPGNANAWNNRGVLLEQQGKNAEALKDFTKALQVTGCHCHCHHYRLPHPPPPPPHLTFLPSCSSTLTTPTPSARSCDCPTISSGARLTPGTSRNAVRRTKT